MVQFLKLPHLVTNVSQRLRGLGLAWAHGGHAQKKYQNFTNFSPKNFAIWRTKDWFLRKMVISPSIGHGSIKDLVEKNLKNFNLYLLKWVRAEITLCQKNHVARSCPSNFFDLAFVSDLDLHNIKNAVYCFLFKGLNIDFSDFHFYY